MSLSGRAHGSEHPEEKCDKVGRPPDRSRSPLRPGTALPFYGVQNTGSIHANWSREQRDFVAEPGGWRLPRRPRLIKLPAATTALLDTIFGKMRNFPVRAWHWRARLEQGVVRGD